MLDNQSGSSADNLVAQMRGAREAASPEPEDRPTGGTDELEAQEAEDSTEYEETETEEADESEYEASESDEHEEGEEEAEEPQRYRVKVDGKELEVDQDELISGYQRDADYRKKTMELAEQRKAVEAKESELAQKVQELESFIEQQDQNIDWDELRDIDPSEYLRQKDLQDKRKAAAEKSSKELQQQQQQQMQERFQTEGAKLIEAMGGQKNWSEQQRTKDMQEAFDHLASLGISEQEANAIADHRFWRTAIDAAKYQKLMKNKGKVSKEVRKAPKSVKPGQRPAPSERAKQEALEKLKGANKHNQTQSLVEAMKSRRRGK